MRTTDFSAAPTKAQATAMFIVLNTRNAAKITRRAMGGSTVTSADPASRPIRLNGTMRRNSAQSTLPMR